MPGPVRTLTAEAAAPSTANAALPMQKNNAAPSAAGLVKPSMPVPSVPVEPRSRSGPTMEAFRGRTIDPRQARTHAADAAPSLPALVPLDSRLNLQIQLYPSAAAPPPRAPRHRRGPKSEVPGPDPGIGGSDKPMRQPRERRGPQMPKRTDIKSILIIGAGPIIIGQACEFDYSGTQACKALQGRGLPDHPGQLQPGDDHDRSRSGRRDLHRADHPRDRRQDHREGAPRRAAAHHGRPDGAQLRALRCARWACSKSTASR